MVLAQGESALTAGVALGLTYILSIGPNNMMLIREGLTRGHVILVPSVVFLSYAAMLLLSYEMTDAVATWNASLMPLLSGLGVAALTWFAFLSVKAAVGREARAVNTVGAGREPLPACLRRVARVTVANPLVYVEFLLIPAGMAGVFTDPVLRFQFIFGLIGMAALACYGYVAGGRACAGLFRHPKAMQIFDLACGCLLAIIALTIGHGLLRSLEM